MTEGNWYKLTAYVKLEGEVGMGTTEATEELGRAIGAQLCTAFNKQQCQVRDPQLEGPLTPKTYPV